MKKIAYYSFSSRILAYSGVSAKKKSRAVFLLYVSFKGGNFAWRSFLAWFETNFYYYSSGNCTPGSRSYSDLVDTWADSVCIYQLVLRPCSKSASVQYNCRWL